MATIKLPVVIKVESYKPSGKYYSEHYVTALVSHLYEERPDGQHQAVSHYMDDAVQAVKLAVKYGRIPAGYHLRINTDYGHPVLIPIADQVD